MIRRIPGNLQLHESRACQKQKLASCSTLVSASSSSSYDAPSAAPLLSAPPASLPDGPWTLPEVLPSGHSSRICIKPPGPSITCRHDCAYLGLPMWRCYLQHLHDRPAMLTQVMPNGQSSRICIKPLELSIVCRHDCACLGCPWGGAQQSAHDNILCTTATCAHHPGVIGAPPKSKAPQATSAEPPHSLRNTAPAMQGAACQVTAAHTASSIGPQRQPSHTCHAAT